MYKALSLVAIAAIASAVPASALLAEENGQMASGPLTDSDIENYGLMLAMVDECHRLERFTVRKVELEWYFEDRLSSVGPAQRALLEDQEEAMKDALDIHRDDADSRDAHRAMISQQCSALSGNSFTGKFFVERS